MWSENTPGTDRSSRARVDLGDGVRAVCASCERSARESGREMKTTYSRGSSMAVNVIRTSVLSLPVVMWYLHCRCGG